MSLETPFTSEMWCAAEHTTLPQPFVTTHASTEVLRPIPFRPIAPAPASRPPVLYSQRSLIARTPMLGSDPPPRVLGLQGSGGILPCSPDSAAAPAAGTSQTKDQMAQMDADGKFPCPRCDKTFQRAKYLKRHFLRREFLFSFFSCRIRDMGPSAAC